MLSSLLALVSAMGSVRLPWALTLAGAVSSQKGHRPDGRARVELEKLRLLKPAQGPEYTKDLAVLKASLWLG